MTAPDSIHLRLSFGRSPSSYYPDAVAIAEGLPGYERSGDGKTTVHGIDVDLPLIETELWDRVHKLYQIAGRWNSCQVVLENTPFESLSDLMRLVGDIRRCYAWREETNLGDAFCSGKNAPDADADTFGCRRIGGVSRALHNRSHAEFSWWQFGNLAADATVFIVDKHAIMDMLRHRASRQVCTFCPAFSWDRVQRDLDDLPAEVSTDLDSRFGLRYSEIDPSRALGIKPRIYSGRPPVLSLDWSEAFDRITQPVPADAVWVAPLARSFHTSHCGVCGDPRWHVSREDALARGLTPCPICDP
jgi:hypothetical protein